jgi:hypothetical protein
MGPMGQLAATINRAKDAAAHEKRAFMYLFNREDPQVRMDRHSDEFQEFMPTRRQEATRDALKTILASAGTAAAIGGGYRLLQHLRAPRPEQMESNIRAPFSIVPPNVKRAADEKEAYAPLLARVGGGIATGTGKGLEYLSRGMSHIPGVRRGSEAVGRASQKVKDVGEGARLLREQRRLGGEFSKLKGGGGSGVETRSGMLRRDALKGENVAQILGAGALGTGAVGAGALGHAALSGGEEKEALSGAFGRLTAADGSSLKRMNDEEFRRLFPNAVNMTNRRATPQAPMQQAPTQQAPTPKVAYAPVYGTASRLFSQVGEHVAPVLGRGMDYLSKGMSHVPGVRRGAEAVAGAGAKLKNVRGAAEYEKRMLAAMPEARALGKEMAESGMPKYVAQGKQYLAGSDKMLADVASARRLGQQVGAGTIGLGTGAVGYGAHKALGGGNKEAKVSDIFEDIRSSVREGLSGAVESRHLPWFLPAMSVGTPLAGYAGYKVVDSLMDAARKREIGDALASAKADFESALRAQYQSAQKSASLAQSVDGLAHMHVSGALADQMDSMEKMGFEGELGTASGVYLTLAALSAMLGHYAGKKIVERRDPARARHKALESTMRMRQLERPPSLRAEA